MSADFDPTFAVLRNAAELVKSLHKLTRGEQSQKVTIDLQQKLLSVRDQLVSIRAMYQIMSNANAVVARTKELEELLRSKFGARGGGIHTLTNSVQDQLSPLVVCGLRQVASIRNRFSHSPAFTADRIPRNFEALCDELVYRLERWVPLKELIRTPRPVVVTSKNKIIVMRPPITPSGLANALGINESDIIQKLAELNIFALGNGQIDESIARDVCEICGCEFRLE